MKTLKKLTCMLVVVALLFCMVPSTAYAANITIDGGATGSEYAAYKLLNATDGGGDKIAYTLNDTYTAVLQSVTGKTEQADIISYIQELDAAGIRTFADAVYTAIKAADPKIKADYTTDDDIFDDVDQGYYLIAETKPGTTSDDKTDTISLVMLNTAGNEAITVKTKEDKPTVVKKVKDTNDSTGETSDWQDSADHDVGDTIEYKITGTVSSKYADYNSYYYSFEDTMVQGLDLNAESIKVTIGDVDVTANFKIESSDHGFTATANLKELDENREDVAIDGDTKVVVTYTATLNEKAVVGAEGNPNEVILKYENNPYHEADGDPNTPDQPEEPGETPKDVNIVFTYKVVVNKVDGDNDEALNGATFELYKKNSDGSWSKVGDTIAGEESSVFEWSHLDDGDYKLVEVAAPAGYNKIPDVEFTVTAEHDVEADQPALKSLTGGDLFTGEVATGTLTAMIENNAGTELPETGGIGTTIFYTVGGLMAVAAVVLLVTKRRMGAED